MQQQKTVLQTNKTKKNCRRRKNIGFKLPEKLCPAAFLEETGENMHPSANSYLKQK